MLAADIPLTVGITDKNHYGHKHGSKAHATQVVFVFDSPAENIELKLRGFDVDLSDEVEIILNDSAIGYLPVGENNAHTSVISIALPTHLLSPLQNRLIIKQNYNGYRWGVSSILLQPVDDLIPLNIGTTDNNRYGYRYGTSQHLNSVSFTFDSNESDLELNVRGFDIDSDTEVQVLLNEQSLGFLSPGQNNRHTDSETFFILKNRLRTTGNIISFRQSTQGYRWGINRIVLTPRDPACRQKTVPFHFASNSNGFLRDDVLASIRDCASLATLNVLLFDENTGISLEDVRERIHAIRPDLPVLLYFRASVWKTNALRADKELLSYIGTRSDWIIHSQDTAKGTTLFPDLTNPEVTDWLADTIATNVQALGFNGAFIDFAVRSPGFICDNTVTPECVAYQAGFDILFEKLDTALAQKPLFFNGVYGNRDIPAQDPVELINRADGAMFEYYGHVPGNSVSDFEKDIQFYWNFISENPDKTFLFYGRIASDAAQESESDWARYLYATYLMASNDKQHFKYNASFQIPSHNDKSGGLHLIPEYALPLGEALGEARSDGCLFSREFSHVTVYFCRHDSVAPATVSSSDGECSVQLMPGDTLFVPTDGSSCGL